MQSKLIVAVGQKIKLLPKPLEHITTEYDKNISFKNSKYSKKVENKDNVSNNTEKCSITHMGKFSHTRVSQI